MNKDFTKLFACGCCKGKFPSLYKHTHHKTPRALGGKDTPDNLIDICPGCHDAIHGTAWKLANKKMADSKAIDAVHLIYKENEGAIKMCLELAYKVRNAMLVGGETELSQDAVVSIATTIRKRHKTLIAARVSELRTSQENYLRGLILTDLAKRFNLSLSATEEGRLIKQLKKGKT